MANEKKSRNRPVITMTLSPEAVGAADEIAEARGWNRSQLVEHLIREEALRFRLDVRKLGDAERRKRRLPKKRAGGLTLL